MASRHSHSRQVRHGRVDQVVPVEDQVGYDLLRFDFRIDVHLGQAEDPLKLAGHDWHLRRQEVLKDQAQAGPAADQRSPGPWWRERFNA